MKKMLVWVGVAASLMLAADETVLVVREARQAEAWNVSAAKAFAAGQKAIAGRKLTYTVAENTDGAFKRLHYNNPGTTYLKAGPKSNYAGGSGRRKFCFTDWTGDGKKDLIANSRNVMLYEFIKKENGKWYFANRGNLDDAPLAGHTTSPTACDFDGDGKEELLVGAEDGFFYLLANER